MNGPKYQRGWIGIAAVMVASIKNPPRKGTYPDYEPPRDSGPGFGSGMLTGLILGESLGSALSSSSTPDFSGGGGVSDGGGASGSW